MKALIVAGETSGDIYGAQLASVLCERIPDLQVSGMGGDRMQETGIELLYHHRSIAVVGVLEVVSKLRNLRQAFRTLAEWVEENSPAFAILIDFPDFNFRLARLLKKRGIKIFYFISPQIWAWRKTRIHFLKKHIDLMITILPFEKALYDAEAIPSTYVGHPLVEIVRTEIQTQKPYDRGDKPLLGLMPGSRDVEVRRHLPVLLETAELLRRQTKVDVLLIRAPSLHSDLYTVPSYIQVVSTDRYAAMKACNFMIVASGTSTLESAILNVPFLIVYRVGGFSWNLGKFLVRVPYYGLVNWIAQKKIVPEFIQKNMRPELLARETLLLLNDPAALQKLKTDLSAVVDSLGPPGAMNRAADAIVSLL
jgi:lipid-A-disaccharide synthase